MSISFVRSAVVLGLLACVGPFAIDLYLPALPRIAEGLETDVAAVQTTFVAYFVAFGLAQLIYGPLADWLGRKPPIFAGLAIFIAGSVICMMAPDIGWLTFGRFVQATGAAAVMVVPRAIIRDLHTGVQATRLMALIMLVISISPMLAPLIGSGIIAYADWRMIFGALIALGAFSFVLTAVQLPETLDKSLRIPVRPGILLKGCIQLMRDMKFMGLTLIGGFGMASFFVFIASASFVYMGEYGLSPVGFSLAFAANAVGFFGASQFAANLSQRFGMARMVLVASVGFAAFTSTLFVLVLSGFSSLPLVMAFLFLGNACFGLVMAPTMVMALEDHGENAGLASSLGGTLQMVAGGIMIFLSQPFFDGSAAPMAGSIAVCALISAILAILTLGLPKKSEQPAE